MKRRKFIQGGLAASGAAFISVPQLFSFSQPDEEITRRKITLKPNGPTVLMGFDAELRGNLKQFPGWPKVTFPGNPDAAKQLQRDRTKWPKYSNSRWWVEEWKGPEDAFAWSVDVPQAGFFEVRVVGTGRESEIELAVGESKLTGWINNGWDVMWDVSHFPPQEGKWRCDFTPPDDYFRFVWSGWNRILLGSLYLPAGTSTIILRATKPGADLALYSLELISPTVERALAAKAAKLRSSTRWMANAKYGLFFHWTSSKSNDTAACWPRRGARKIFPANVDAFDATAFAKMVSRTGAGYIIFTSTWADHYFPAPIHAIDTILPGRTSKRDLLMDIANALEKYGVKMMLYYHLGASDPEWWNATQDHFVDNWCAIVSEAGQRYGDKLAGWWFDSLEAYYTRNVPFDRLAEAAKSGNPARLVSYNNGNFWPKFTDFQDFVGAEGPHYWVDESLLRDLPQGGSGIYQGGRHEGLQAHQCFPLESPGWIHNRPDSEISAPSWDETNLIKRMKDAGERKFVPTLAIEVYEDGTASERTLQLLDAIKVVTK